MSAPGLFGKTWGHSPSGVWSSPGRVNLIGEHTDYNDGLVLPFAIDDRAAVAAALTDDGLVSVVSDVAPDEVHTAAITDLTPGGTGAQGWSAYLNGAVWVLTEAGHAVPGVRFALSSTVPVGAGLSSSAALECATLLALSDLLGLGLERPELARLAQRDENDFVGMPCGLMDQMASAACTAGNVLFFDIGADTTEQVPFDPVAEGLRVLVIDTQVKHALVDGEYAKRRRSCEAAAAELGVPNLSVIDVADLDAALAKLSDDVLVRRARHIITENARVTDTVARLRAGRITDIGDLMVASHVSLRDDYEVSDPSLDLAVDVATSSGALGARMTGGGFGGSAIALVPADLVDTVGEAVTAAFAADGRTPPVLRTVLPSAGAARD
ncbi:galactokinase [Nakamurella deserti]|uniref:galactokinase n=1 Tax=Nakamurella deserti TaxID=2164074 RepID=UPI000DBE907C|nr:galactokinase [Nakamurella deserti]